MGVSKKPRKSSKTVGKKTKIAPPSRDEAEDKAAFRPALPFPVVAVGASAGGLAAFTELLKALPTKTGMAFVLIQHLEPNHESALTTILAKATDMPVKEVADGMAVEPNAVFIIPPNKNMVLRRGKLRLTPRSNAAIPQRPIDTFSTALAEEQGDAAIGVVLSGTGSDGTYGLKAIKAAGGVTFAQDSKTAQWPAMPMNAITAGSVDFVLSPKRIAVELTRIARHPYLVDATEVPEGSDLDKVSTLVRSATGVDFRLYKQATVRRRLARRMALHKITSLGKYLLFLKQNREEAQALADDVFVHVTSFFRDPECFLALRKKVLAKLAAKRPAEEYIRIWVAGCSTGEEVYSIAISLLEELGDRINRLKVQIFATDIQERAVQHARTAIYTQAAVAGVSPARLKRFFVETDHGYQIQKFVRDICVFARHDLSKDPPFSRLDLISCRNVLIYMGPPLQRRMLAVFQYGLKPGGFLFLGNSESISNYSDAFTVEDQKHRIFSRKPGLPTFNNVRPSAVIQPSAPVASARTPVANSSMDFRKETEALLLQQYTPAAIVVDPELHILHFQGDVSPYLGPQTGQPSLHLLKMVRPEFVVDLRAAISRVRKEGIKVHKDAMQFTHDGQPAAVRFEVQPLQRRHAKKHDLIIVFQRVEPIASVADTSNDKQAAARSARVAEELASARENLRTLIAEHETAQEEMKAANEEILSSNEELQSTNEELETAKEELQSANEELVTLNDELQHRNEDLTILTHDLNNLLVGVNIPVLLLDSEQRVRRFTPLAGALLNLIPGDVGRPFGHIASGLDVKDWDALFSQVMNEGRLIEREVQNRDGHRYSMTVRAYKTSENKIEGVLVVLLDTETIYLARDDARRSGDYSRAIVETIHEALLVVDSDFKILSVNRSFSDLFKVSLTEMAGRPFFGNGPGQFSVPRLNQPLQNVISKRVTIQDLEFDHEFVNIGYRCLALSANPIDDSGTILIALEDITERKQSQERELTQLRTFVERAPMGVIMLDRKMRAIQVSQRYLDDVGLTRDQVLGRSHYEYLPDLPVEWRENHRRGLAGESLSGREECFRSPDGKEHWVNWRITPWGNSGETTGGILVASDDITEWRHAQEESRRAAATVRSLLESAPQSVVVVSADEKIVMVNGNTEPMFGYSREELVGQNLSILIPEDLRALHAKHHENYFADMRSRLMGLGLSLEARRKDGTVFPVEVGLSALSSDGNKLAAAFVSDISERKRMEQAVASHAKEVQALAASLLNAQEDERRRVSIELHDQICQQLAALAIDMGSLAAEQELPSQLQTRVTALQKRVVNVSDETRHLAYELHSTVLDDLGLVAAMQELCHDFSKHNQTAVKFTHAALPSSIPREAAACFYRVTKEALQNIAKHAKAKHAAVDLSAEQGVLILKIADDGVGFDLKAAKGRGGLGLIGMEERVRHVKGEISIAPNPHRGSRILVRIPVNEDRRM